MNKGKFYAVGIGAGNPLDMTLKAKQVLESADAILIPVKKTGEKSTAYNIAVQSANIGNIKTIEVVFPMKLCADYMAYLNRNILSEVFSYLESGKDVAMVTLGDVSVYSTASYVRQYVQNENFDTEVVAGIPSFCVSASRANISLCENDESLTIVPAVSSKDKIKKAIEDFDNIVIMKAGKALEWLIPFLEENNLAENTMMFCNVGMDNEYIGRLENKNISYFTTLIIKKKGIK
jgi:precorrin-2/cobalt-factor-2 C20-methyltransferase